MTAIEHIAESLKSADYQPVLASSDKRQLASSPLVVPFRPDELGREYVLFIEVMPKHPDDAAEFIHFALVYPFIIEDAEHIPEVIRVLFLLNRFLPVGQHQLCEQTPAIFFRYQLAVADAGAVSAELIAEIVNMIGFFTRNHGRFLSRVFRGELTADQLLEELEAQGVSIPPIFAVARRAASAVPSQDNDQKEIP